MRRRQFLKTTGIAAATATGLSASAASVGAERADDAPDPSAYLTNEQLTRRLKLLNRESEAISLRPIGRSAGLGDPIWELTVGEGDTNVHLITQIHGDEPAGTEAILIALRQMVSGDPERFRPILENVTLTVVPRVNPDGAMFAKNVDDDPHEERLTRRQNTQPWCRGDSRHEPYYHDTPDGERPGYDMNRDFNVRTELDAGGLPADWWQRRGEEGETEWALNMPYEGYTLPASGLRLAPEVRAVTESFLRADPDYAITHHHQGLASVPESEPPQPTIMSVMASFGPAYESSAPFYDPDAPLPENVNPFLDERTSERSLRLNKLVADALAETTGPWDVFDTVTRYGYTTLWGSYLDALCPQTGAAGMLYEISGQSDQVGSRAYGLKVEASRVGFLESFAAMADDPSLSGVDASGYFDIPLSGEELPDDSGAEGGRGGARGGAREGTPDPAALSRLTRG